MLHQCEEARKAPDVTTCNLAPLATHEQHTFITHESVDPATTIHRNALWWKWLHDHIREMRGNSLTKPRVLYLRTDSDPRKMAEFNANAPAGDIDGHALSPASVTTDLFINTMADFSRWDAVILAGPNVFALDRFPQLLDSFVSNALVVAASGPAAGYLFERYVPRGRDVFGSRKGCGFLPGTAEMESETSRIRLPTSCSDWLHFRGNIVTLGRNVLSEMQPRSSHGMPFPPGSEEQLPTRVALIGGTPEAGFRSTHGLSMLAYLLGLVRQPRKQRLVVAYIGVAKGDESTVQHDLSEAFRTLGANVWLRFANVAVPHSEHLDLDEIFNSADIGIIGGGRTKNREAVSKVMGLDEKLLKAARAGIPLAGLSDGGVWLSRSGIKDFNVIESIDGIGLTQESFVPHTELPDRFDAAGDVVLLGHSATVLALPTLFGALYEDGKLVDVVSFRDPLNDNDRLGLDEYPHIVRMVPNGRSRHVSRQRLNFGYANNQAFPPMASAASLGMRADLRERRAPAWRQF